MNDRPKVSVIIPVYNAESYLHDCINSLLAQTLKECEFIFINDGSTDRSLNILEQYQAKDNRIIVINQDNCGISRARNRGLNVSRGEYIGFCDNDDVVRNTMFATLYSAAKKFESDIVISKTIFGRDGKEIIKAAPFNVDLRFEIEDIKKQLIPNLLATEDLFAVWNKLYSADLIQKFAVKFPENRDIEEDSMFNFSAFSNSVSAVFLDYAGYHFREHQASESRRLFDKDYFKLALERFNFDYKKAFNLQLENSEVERLKAIRLVNRVFFLSFTYSITKNVGFDRKFEEISKMIFHPEIKNIFNKFSPEILTNAGKYEKLIFTVVKNPSRIKLQLIIFLVSTIYSPKLSELLRYINGKK